jgi:long-chain acyl-CoA synthetase
VDAFVRERVAAFNYPPVYHVVESLPLGPSGKVLRRELSAQYAPGAAAGADPTR